ncbi:MAG: adenylate/guanylate cyclase domain-containing protein [Deltaproteobacteria bacterium]|nr:adenylate/guanylate cyclase domain-containing protein [Deltaproteobacteria bacterium]
MSNPLHEKISSLESSGVDRAVCRSIEELITKGDPVELSRLVPPRLAARWKAHEDAVLDAFLAGTRAGLFELQWDVKCPSCAGPAAHASHLAQLTSDSRCQLCDLDFAGSFDESVEVTWRPHPAVMDLSNVDPASVVMGHSAPSFVADVAVPARSEARIDVDLTHGNYLLRAPSIDAVRGIYIGPDTIEARDTLSLAIVDQRIERGPWRRPAGPYSVVVRSSSTEPQPFAIFKVSDRPWISAARLAAHQGFRDLFSKELISTDESFTIKSAAFVFTDIKGSTELYERVGDARAYPLVRDHFQIMGLAVKRNGGAIVKTIGDAVMATFMTSASAVRFALDMLEEFDRFNASDPNCDAIIVKVGVHAGPCIAVTSNDRLDYFGRTINTAARVQGLSRGRDLVMSRSVAESVGVQTIVDAAPYRSESFEAELKGIASAFEVTRLVRARV